MTFEAFLAILWWPAAAIAILVCVVCAVLVCMILLLVIVQLALFVLTLLE